MMIRGADRAPCYTMKQEATRNEHRLYYEQDTAFLLEGGTRLLCWRMALDFGFGQAFTAKNLSA
jgi:hypothetical protein